ncbi:MAG: hypothetical protein ACTS6J_23965, partial [Burkholderiales bacterium]
VLAFCAFLWFYAIPYHIKGALPALLPKTLTISLMIPCVLFFYKGIEAARRGVSASSFRIIPGATLLNFWFPDPNDATRLVILSYLVRVFP